MTPAERAVDSLSVWAVRYALGRRTYAVADVTGTLVAWASALNPKSREVIIRDITDAEQSDRLGMPWDAKRWLHLRATLEALQ